MQLETLSSFYKDCSGATLSIKSVHKNIIISIYPNVNVGAELNVFQWELSDLR